MSKNRRDWRMPFLSQQWIENDDQLFPPLPPPPPPQPPSYMGMKEPEKPKTLSDRMIRLIAFLCLITFITLFSIVLGILFLFASTQDTGECDANCWRLHRQEAYIQMCLAGENEFTLDQCVELAKEIK